MFCIHNIKDPYWLNKIFSDIDSYKLITLYKLIILYVKRFYVNMVYL